MLIGLPNKPAVSIGFIGFHSSFNPIWNNITHSLVHRYSLDVSEPDSSGHLPIVPDVLFFSVFANAHLDPRYDRCLKVFTCEENIRPPWPECQFAMTGDYSNDPNHLRLPIYVRAIRHVQDQPSYTSLRSPCPTLIKDPTTDWKTVLALKTKFCNFVYSNEHWRDPRAAGECGLELRIRFFELLSKYKRVDSGGKIQNNLGYQVQEKLPFLEPYKLTIAFENSSYPGYVSEKIVDPMFVHSIPIYWGSDQIADDFNPRSLVIATGRKLEDVVDEVISLDLDDSACLAKLEQPWFADNTPNHYCQTDYIVDFMKKVFQC